MGSIKSDHVLDAKGLACPMPIVRTKKAINEMVAGQVLEVQATDKGSTADLKAWAERSGHQYLGTQEYGSVLKHYVRKSSGEEKEEKKHPNIISNEELISKLARDESLILIDVREEAEYAFGHIPGAVSIPLGELDSRFDEINWDAPVCVVCRTGNRSDLAAQKLAEKGLGDVFNVVPGMIEWTGKLNRIQEGK
ncbi:MAG TPA: sulfurtransferase TusA family protein [Bacillaceae bacterium]